MAAGELEPVFQDGSWYNARIDSIKFDESNGGTPGLVVMWMATEGEMAGRLILDERWLTEASVARHRKAFLEVFDYDLGKKDLSFIRELEGAEAAIKIKQEEWPPGSGKKRSKVGLVKKKGDFSQLSPTHRAAKLFGNEATREDEWEKDKKF